jgi:hypothetical protein
MSSLRATLTLLFAAALTACTGAAGPGGSPRPDSNVITREQIEASNAQNMYDVIQSVRPTWLRTRGTQSFRENATAGGSGTGAGATVEVTPGTGTIVVYLDNSRLGDLTALRQVSPQSVGSAQWYTPAAATTKWGGGHTHGAIQLVPIVLQR